MKKRNLYIVCSDADRAAADAIGKALGALDVSVKHGEPQKNGALLLLESAAFSLDESAQAAFFDAFSQKLPVIPVNLDGSTPPETVQNALFAYNAIFAERYSIDALAKRIADALPAGPSVPAWIPAVAGVLLAAVVGIVLWRVWPKGTAEETAGVSSSPTPTERPVYIPKETGLRPEDLEKVYEIVVVGDQFLLSTGEEDWVGERGYARIGAEHFAHYVSDEDGERWISNETGEEVALARHDDLDFLSYCKNAMLLTLVRVEGKLPDLSDLQKLDAVEILDCRFTDIEGVRGSSVSHFAYRGETVTDFSPLNNCPKISVINLRLLGPADLKNLATKSANELIVRVDGVSDMDMGITGITTGKSLKRVELDHLGITDLSFLRYAENLSELRLSNLPALESLQGIGNKVHLNTIQIENCERLSDLSALAGTGNSSGQWVELRQLPALTSLNGLDLAVGLRELSVQSCENLTDLSALSACDQLVFAELVDLPITDLSGFSGADRLDMLRLVNMDRLRSLHGLEGHGRLKTLEIDQCSNLSDISGLSGCSAMDRLFIGGEDGYPNLYDLTVLNELTELRELELYGPQAGNVDFLYSLSRKDNFRFGISGADNYDGLAAIESYQYLNLSNNPAPNGVGLSAALEIVRDIPVETLDLHLNDRAADLSLLGHITRELNLHNGTFTSLAVLPALPVFHLSILDCQYLTSLDGIQNLQLLTVPGDLQLSNCPRLSDYTALDGGSIDLLYLDRLFALPDFSRFKLWSLQMEGIEELTDLSCLNGLDETRRYREFRFSHMPMLADISELYRLHGETIIVAPGLAEQAWAIVDSGAFHTVEELREDYNWQPNEINVMLLSLDELDTLPPALLAHVQTLWMAGDTVYQPSQYWIEENWDTNPPTLYLHESDGDGRIPVETGTLTDFSKLAVLTGVTNINIEQQGFTSLDGIQSMRALDTIQIRDCPNLTDASAVFAVQNLTWLNLGRNPITSIRGVQNLLRLEELGLYDTRITSIAGVEKLPRLRELDISGAPVEDLSPLETLGDDVEVRLSLPGLMSYDDFTALPQTVLDRIDSLAFSGNYVHSPWGNWWFEIDWGTHRTYIHNNSTGERIPCEVGTITDLNDLSVMKNLRNLQINNQPIENLNGLEKQPVLRQFRMQWCPGVTDVSLLFTLPQLEDISVRDSQITSLAGIGALPHLLRVDVGGGGVPLHTLSWLEEIDFTYAETVNDEGYTPHFDLSIDWWKLSRDELSYLALVPYYASLNVNGHDRMRWTDVLKDTPIITINMEQCEFDNASFKAFVESHPMLRKIDLRENPNLTDISILQSLPSLQTVWIDPGMQQAIASLGDGCGFRLEIE